MKKLNVLYVKYLPSSYKQCSEAQALHLCFHKEEAFLAAEDEALRKKYLRFAKDTVCEEIKNANIVARPDVVKVNGEYFVLFKSNVDQRVLDILVRNLLMELNEYTYSLLEFTYNISTVMVMGKDMDPTIFGSFKMGDDYFEKISYKDMKSIDLSATKSRTKYFKSYDEYKNETECKGYEYYI